MKKILMVEPKYFTIEYSINPHMQDMHGNLNKVDQALAYEQWLQLKKVYENLGFQVVTIEGVPGLPDIVFCANQSFPYRDAQGQKHVVLSNMHSDVRQKEVQFFEDFFKQQNYCIEHIGPRDEHHFFESTGDAIFMTDEKLILGGYGFRTNKEIYEILSQKTKIPIATFKLTHPKFYHLDTCLSVLNQTSALYCPAAFDEEGIERLHKIFPNLIEVPLHEADSPGFACNAHCPNQKHVILQKGSAQTCKNLVEKGFVPVEVDTSEFIKAGGSVFCMKLEFF